MRKGSDCMTSFSSLLCAISLTIPELPQVIPPEVEVVTNISLAAWSDDTRIVALDMVKVGCRGSEVACPQILLSAHTIPFRLIVR